MLRGNDGEGTRWNDGERPLGNDGEWSELVIVE